MAPRPAEDGGLFGRPFVGSETAVASSRGESCMHRRGASKAVLKLRPAQLSYLESQVVPVSYGHKDLLFYRVMSPLR